MEQFILSGHVVDVILAVLALEVVLLPGLSRRGGRPLTRVGLVISSLPGLFLLLALRAALTQAGWPWVAGCLAASFPAHLVDLWRRPP